MIMMKALKSAKATLPVLAGIALMSAAPVHAAPVTLSATQMDAVAAGGVEKVDGFVCPVISTAAVLNSTKGIAIGDGQYSIAGPIVSVPVHATNRDGAGRPGPGNDRAAPGDSDYTAIWGIRP